MKIAVKTFQELSTAELYEILRARADVFVMEQRCFYPDPDGVDYEALHLFTAEDGRVQSYLRLYADSTDFDAARIGRVLTLHRGRGDGMRLMHEAIAVARDRLLKRKVMIDAQCHAIGFYEKLGFHVTTSEFMEAGIPHVGMELALGAARQTLP